MLESPISPRPQTVAPPVSKQSLGSAKAFGAKEIATAATHVVITGVIDKNFSDIALLI
jgi:hypothetical protein